MSEEINDFTMEDANGSMEDQTSESGEPEEIEDDDGSNVSETDEDSSSDDTSDEDEDVDEGQEPTKKKLTAEERKAQLQAEIQDLANQRRALKETLEREVVEKIQEEIQKTKEQAPPFIELDWDRLNEHVGAELESIDQLKLEGRATEALIRQKQLDKLYSQIEENEKKKIEWSEKQQREAASKQDTENINNAIAQAATIVQKALNISEDDWKLGEQWFLEKRRSDPLIDTQYREKVFTQGPAHALKWAADYVREHMGEEAKKAKEKREEGKKKTVGGATAGDTSAKTPSSFDDLMKLSDRDLVRLERSNPKLFNKLISQRLKK